MRTLELEWIEADDDGLDPHWLELSPEHRWRTLEELREYAFRWRDAALHTVTPRRMDRRNLHVDLLEFELLESVV
jgi:hypothetical protein